mmetsp:Transcript_9847/g.30349  ORF Transcript_9847/g.30349 Transcript_9847/m.30349 type:complete len:768 (-) Transcript_9847:65-2368(-)
MASTHTPTTPITTDLSSSSSSSSDAVEEHVQLMAKKRLSANTHARYATHQKLFLAYVDSAEVRSSHAHLYDGLGRFELKNLTAEDFKRYLSCRALGLVPGRAPAAQRKVGKKSIELDRSALLELYRIKGLPPPKPDSDFQKALSEYMRGVASDESDQRPEGVLNAEPGKREMRFDMYLWLARKFLAIGDLFAWSFLLLCWNTMARANNTSHIAFPHLACAEDALRVSIPKSKTNQAGKENAVPKHLYANPTDVALCPVTALGVYLLLGQFSADQRIYPGGSQSKRFSSSLQRVLASPEGQVLLREHGLASKDVGIHSLRKGGASLVLNGIAGGGASVTAVLIRGEWALGNVQKRYWKCQDAGDQLIGRLLAGLSTLGVSFALLPPHFVCTSVEQRRKVALAVESAFPTILRHHPRAQGVLQMCFASVIHHRQTLCETLPEPVRSTFEGLPAFSEDSLAQVRPLLVRDAAFQSPCMKATGIPPHVFTLHRLEQMERQGARQMEGLAAHLTGELREELTTRLETLGVAGQSVTGLGLQQALAHQSTALMERMREEMSENMERMREMVEQMAPGPLTLTGAATTESDLTTLAATGSGGSPSVLLHRWPGDCPTLPCSHRLPHDYVLPRLCVEDGWVAWFLGFGVAPSLSKLQSRDFHSRNQRTYFSKWGLLMSQLELIAEEHATELWRTFQEDFENWRLLDCNTERTTARRGLEQQLRILYPILAQHLDETRPESQEGPYSVKRKRKRVAQRKVTTVAKLLAKRLRTTRC